MVPKRWSQTMEKLFEIIHEDAELLVINKPAGLVCHPTKGDVYSSLISRVRLHLGAAARPHLVNRLDRETSGVVIVAKQDEAARELRRLWEGRLVQKDYWALCTGIWRRSRGLSPIRWERIATARSPSKTGFVPMARRPGLISPWNAASPAPKAA